MLFIRPMHPRWLGVALLIACGVTLAGCGKKSSEGSEVTTASGLKYVDEVVGTGDKAKLGRTVIVHYTGWLENGTKFDSSVDRGQPLNFKLGTDTIIQGWNEGILGMRVGGKRKLIIPPGLGYGAQGKGRIPPNATLIFEVELLGAE